MLEIGDKAPDFSLPAEGDTTVSLSDYSGKKLVLYFYPKDSTPGCTKQAIAFTELKDAFADAGAEILGVSKDSVKRHENFRAKNDLTIALGSDEEGEMLEAYGVWVEKKNYGKTYMGIERTTLLIDEKGVIQEIWRKVRVAGHVEKVLETVQGA